MYQENVFGHISFWPTLVIPTRRGICAGARPVVIAKTNAHGRTMVSVKVGAIRIARAVDSAAAVYGLQPGGWVNDAYVVFKLANSEVGILRCINAVTRPS